MDVTAVRHVVATLAYRAAKVLRDTPPEFATKDFGPHTRQPVQIVAHMADLMAWGVTMSRGEYVWTAGGSDDWAMEVRRFFDGLRTIDEQLAASPPPERSIQKLIQGPLADALTHVGQLAMLRGMMGIAVRPESYARADIVVGRVGAEQPAPRYEFDGDASTRTERT